MTTRQNQTDRTEVSGPGHPALILVACAAAALVFYRAFVFDSGRMLFGTDMLSQAYQLRKFGLDQLRSGNGFPLWNPYVYGGLPYLEILPGPVFYPTSLLYFAMPLGRAIGWTFVFHTFAAGALAYYAGRVFRLERWAAAVVGFAFMFNGYLVSMVYGGHDGRMFALTLFPLTLALTERGFQTGRPRWFVALGLVTALQIVTPHVQMMYYGALMLSLYALFRLVGMWRVSRPGPAVGPRAEGGREADGGRAGKPAAGRRARKGDIFPRRPEAGAVRTAAARGHVLKLGGYFVLAFVVAALIGSVQLLPTLRIMEFAVRGVPGVGSYEFAASWALPPQEITAFLFPDLVGSLDTYWGTNPFKLHTEYVGVVTLALALVAIVARWRQARVWFFVVASLLGVLFALGAATPVHRLAFALVPQIDNFRAPSMMLGPVTLFVALLAGLGWQSVLDARKRDTALPWAWIWLASAPVLVIGLAALLAPRGLTSWMLNGWFPAGWQRIPPDFVLDPLRVNGAFVVGLWIYTLLSAWMVVARRVPAWTTAPLLLLLVIDLWRVDGRYVETVVESEFFQPDQAITFMQARMEPGERVWPFRNSYGPNDLMTFGVPAVTGSQNFRLRWYDELVGGLSNENLTRHTPLWVLFDLRFLTAPEPINLSILRGVAVGPRGHVYAMPEDPPHAWFPERIEVATENDEAIQRTVHLVDPRLSGIVEAAEAPPAGRGSASVTRYLPNEIELQVEADEGGLLFVSEIFHPAWEAFLDGHQVPVLRANGAFRGVVVPAGTHRLVFRYSAAELHLPAIVSVLTLLLVLAYLGAGAVRAWKRSA